MFRQFPEKLSMYSFSATDKVDLSETQDKEMPAPQGKLHIICTRDDECIVSYIDPWA